MRTSDYFLEFHWKPIFLAGRIVGNFYVMFENAAGTRKKMNVLINGAGVGEDTDDVIDVEIYKRMLQVLSEVEVRVLRSTESGMHAISDYADFELKRRHKSLNDELQRHRAKRTQLFRASDLGRSGL